jgi:uroporphyrinogen-III synthase
LTADGFPKLAEALAFARALAEGGFDVVIFLSGVGMRALVQAVESICPREKLAELLRGVKVVARGPKPVAALAALGVPVAVTAPEPNTWRELLQALDDRKDKLPLKGRRVALQEYGVSNAELLAALAQRGAMVTRVPVYEWALPEDTMPLRNAVECIVRGEIELALFTTSIQVVHMLKIAVQMGCEDALRQAFQKVVVGSIGPMTSDVLQQEGIGVDFEPQHPKMGFLVSEAAQRAGELIPLKRASANRPIKN